MMLALNPRKISYKTKRTLLGSSLILLFLSLVGCSTTRTYLNGKEGYLEALLRSVSASIDIDNTSMDISIPDAYGNIPAHPDDPGSVASKVSLKSGSYSSTGLSIDISPLPFHNIENLKLGYRATFPSGSANQIRKGLSDMEWYESGAYAGTYSRVKLPTTIHSIRASWRQPIPLNWLTDLFVEPGLSYDFWKVRIQGGWDRYYREETMLENKLRSETLNPFVRAGLNMTGPYENWSVGISFFWKPEKIKGDTSYGNVDIKGDTYGFGVTFGF